MTKAQAESHARMYCKKWLLANAKGNCQRVSMVFPQFSSELEIIQMLLSNINNKINKNTPVYDTFVKPKIITKRRK
jgi:hypothetical protein